jgi:hypothetical protein
VDGQPQSEHSEESSERKSDPDAAVSEGSEAAPTSSGPDGADPPTQEPPSPPEPPLKVELIQERKPRFPKEFWIAAVSIVATAIASVVATVMTLLTSNSHDKRESERQKASFTQENEHDQTKFRQDQQKEAYAGFANAASDLEAAIHQQVYAIVGKYPNFHLSKSLTGNADVDSSYIALLHARNLASLFGSTEVRNALIEVIDKATTDRDDVDIWDSQHKNSSRIPSCNDLMLFTLQTQETDRQALESAIEHFNEVARADLRIPALGPKPPPHESDSYGECAENAP